MFSAYDKMIKKLKKEGRTKVMHLLVHVHPVWSKVYQPYHNCESWMVVEVQHVFSNLKENIKSNKKTGKIQQEYTGSASIKWGWQSHSYPHDPNHFVYSICVQISTSENSVNIFKLRNLDVGYIYIKEYSFVNMEGFN